MIAPLEEPQRSVPSHRQQGRLVVPTEARFQAAGPVVESIGNVGNEMDRQVRRIERDLDHDRRLPISSREQTTSAAFSSRGQ